MRAAVYLRQSLDVTEGIDRQRERTLALLNARGWELAGEYTDNDTSASKSRATGTDWARLLEDIKRGTVETVVAVDLDRLLRSTRDLNTLIDLGAKVVTVDGEIDLSTADGEFRATMLAGIARFEVRRKSERQQRANQQRAQQGKRTGASRRQFGYAKDGKTLIDSEATAVRDGYGALLSGVPLAAIARDWNQRGLATTQKRQARSGHAGELSAWRHDNVRAVLLNPRNAGIATYAPMMDDPRPEHVGRRLSGPRQEVSGAGEAEWPALVDEATFRAAGALLRDPVRRSARSSGSTGGKYLLSGIALCGIEGCEGCAHAGGAARPGVRAYRCSASNGHFARKAEPVEDYVAALVIERLSRPDARQLLLKPGADTKAMHREVLVIEHHMSELAGLVADGTFTPTQARSATDKLKAQRAELEGRIADAGRTDILGPLVGAASPKAAWTELGTDRQRAVIDLLMTVTLHGVGRGTRTFRTETVGIDWKMA